MSANTAVAENFANFSVEKRLKTDSFTIADEHYVGHDGFVVPKDSEAQEPELRGLAGFVILIPLQSDFGD